MADSKLAHKDQSEGASPAPRFRSQDAPRSRSERKDKSKSSGSSDPAPEGQPRKLEFGAAEEGGHRYSPRNINPETPIPPKQVPQLVAAFEGMQGDETDEEAEKRHNEEAEKEKAQKEADARKALHEQAAADGFKALEQADAEGYAAALERVQEGQLEPIQIIKSNPFAPPKDWDERAAAAAQQQPTPTPVPEQPTPNPNAEQIPVPTPTKRKKSPGDDGKDDDDNEMEEDGGDPSTLAPEVQLRKIHQTLKKFSDRIGHSEDAIEGQGRMVDEVAARNRIEEQEKISRTYEILGIPEKANTKAFLAWLISDPEAANIPMHEVHAEASMFSKPKDGKKNFAIVFRATGSKSKMDAYMSKRTDLRFWDEENGYWNDTKITGRWTETLLQRDKRELLNIAWQAVKEKFGIDAVFDNTQGLLLDHKCNCIRYKQNKKPLIVVTLAENAGDPRAKIFVTAVNPFSFKQMEDMIEERMKQEQETREKNMADNKIARANTNPDYVPKYQDTNIRRSALKYWRRTYRNITDLQTLKEYSGTWNDICEHAAKIVLKEKEAWERGEKGTGKGRGKGRGKGKGTGQQPTRYQEGGSSGSGEWKDWSGWRNWGSSWEERSFDTKWNEWKKP